MRLIYQSRAWKRLKSTAPWRRLEPVGVTQWKPINKSINLKWTNVIIHNLRFLEPAAGLIDFLNLILTFYCPIVNRLIKREISTRSWRTWTFKLLQLANFIWSDRNKKQRRYETNAISDKPCFSQENQNQFIVCRRGNWVSRCTNDNYLKG